MPLALPLPHTRRRHRTLRIGRAVVALLLIALCASSAIGCDATATPTAAPAAARTEPHTQQQQQQQPPPQPKQQSPPQASPTPAPTPPAAAPAPPAAAPAAPVAAAPFSPSPLPPSGSSWSAARRAALASSVREMFQHSYDAYLRDAFPHDELKPLSRGFTDSLAELGNAAASAPSSRRGSAGQRDASKPYRGFALTLIDSLSTLAVLEDREAFCAGVAWVEQHLTFDVDLRVHVFEATIRMLGGLLSAHLLVTDPDRGPALTKDVLYTPLPATRGAFVPSDKMLFQYRGRLLHLARDLGERMLRAFPLDSVSPPATPSADALREAQAAKAGLATPVYGPVPQSALPYAFVHLQAGVLEGETDETCTACSGTLLLEFGVLSALTNDARFFHHADAALQALWGLRHPSTGLFPATFSRSSGLALDPVSGIGASLDSFYEYLLKTSLLFDRKSNLDRFWQTYVNLNRHLRISAVYNATDTGVFNEEKAWPLGSEEAKAAAAVAAAAAAKAKGKTKATRPAQQKSARPPHHPSPPAPHRPHVHARRHLHSSLPASIGMCPAQLSRDWFIESHFQSGLHAHLQFQSLSSFWPGVLVLAGQVDEARTLHEAAYSVWQSFGALPERYFFAGDTLHPSERYYPLRPELSESTYLLYRATRDDLYLDVGERMLRDLNLHARVASGGFAGIANVDPAQRNAGKALQQEDRMQSFFLAETLKYLYLLFAPDASSSPAVSDVRGADPPPQPHWLHRPHLPHNRASDWIFSTEGHLFPVRQDLQRPFSDDEVVWRDVRDWGREEARSAENRRAAAAAAAAGKDALAPVSSLPPLPLSSSPSPDLLAWDSKRRFDLRVAQVGRGSALKEVTLAGPAAMCPQLRRVMDAGTALEPLLTISQVQQAASAAADPAADPPHPLSRLFRFQSGLFHPSLITEVGYPAQNAPDARRFEQKYSYALSRLLGEETARGAIATTATPSSPALGRLPALAYPHPPAAGGAQPFTGKYARSETVPPVSIRDALLLPRNEGGAEAMGSLVRGLGLLNHMQSPLHSASLPSNRAPPANFWEYDRDWLRFVSKMRSDAARMAAYEEWQLAQTTTRLRRKSEGVAQPHSELGASIKAAPLRGGSGGAAGTNTPSVKGDGVPTTGTLLINGQTVPLPPELLQMLQAHAAANVIPPPVGGRGPLAQGSPLSPSQNSPLRGDPGSSSIRAGDFSVESEAGAFHVVHAPSSTTLTIRNLATDAVELINERILPAEPEDATAHAPAASSSGSPPPVSSRPRNRVQMLTVDSESYLHAHSVVLRGVAGGACDRITVPGAGGHFGVVPPPELPDDPSQLSLFLGAGEVGRAVDAQALLKNLGQARRAEVGQLTAYIVRADPIQACSAFTPSQSLPLRGRLVFVERGGCTFVDKALAIQAAGGLGMVVWNSFDPNYLFMQGSDQSGREVGIPSVMVDANGGEMIQRCMDESVTAHQSHPASPPRPQLVASIRRDSYEPGQMVHVAPAVQYRSPAAAAAASSAASSSSSSSPPSSSPSTAPVHVRFEGGLDHFTLRTMAGWTAEVNYDESAHNYQLKLY